MIKHLNLNHFIFYLFTFLSIQLHAQKELVEVKKFGSNPGKLKLFIHEPKSEKSSSLKKPLVIVLHGCSQNAESISKLTHWNKLADKYGFYVIYPQQNLVNNPSLCFNWFSNEDVTKDQGESLSIKQMIDFTSSKYPIDNERVFVYGVSAGAAMSVVMMADYPQLINAGASLAGGPFLSELNDNQRLETMFNPKDYLSEKLGLPIKKLNPTYTGNYPRIIILQGKNDMVVNPKNAQLLINQWSFLHNIEGSLTTITSSFNGSRDVVKYAFKNSKEETKVIFYEIDRMGHSIPVDPGTAPNQGGTKTMYTIDKDFFSTFFIARDFGLIPDEE